MFDRLYLSKRDYKLLERLVIAVERLAGIEYIPTEELKKSDMEFNYIPDRTEQEYEEELQESLLEKDEGDESSLHQFWLEDEQALKDL